MAGAVLLWLRQDLRLRDHPALHAARLRGGPIIPVYIHDDAGEGRWPVGAAGRFWLHHSLQALQADLEARGGRLILRAGDSSGILAELMASTGVEAVYWCRRYEPAVRQRDAALEIALRAQGVEVRTFNGSLLHEPDQIRNRQGRPFQVFTPFWRYCFSRPVDAPLGRVPTTWPAPRQWPPSLRVEELELAPRRSWDRGFYGPWGQPGEAGAQRALRRFLQDALGEYERGRDSPGRVGTSRLSPHLHWGEISPRQVWAAVASIGRSAGIFPPNAGAQRYLAELGWREFAYHLLYHFPDTPERPKRREFESFPWRDDPDGRLLHAWQSGRTGYPIVDAGLRELWATGWMHNRVRMITASFLVKHLRLPWTAGAAWFWDMLVDADLANNTLGWQWVAGCGADASPYFRIFNPMTQGAKFDPAGDYVRRWLPELAELPAKYLHAPWTAPGDVLARSGVELGRTYPAPLVDHQTARDDALAAFQQFRRATA